jgi:hypothetical protein
VTVPVPLPFDSMFQVQPTFPLAPTVRAEPLNDTGALPVEYSTLAVQSVPCELHARREFCDVTTCPGLPLSTSRSSLKRG